MAVPWQQVEALADPGAFAATSHPDGGVVNAADAGQRVARRLTFHFQSSPP
jgi:hypothetical protein